MKNGQYQFRAWDLVGKKWIDLNAEGIFLAPNEEDGLGVVGQGGYFYYAVIHQWSGLLDKNGKEIYEGDIVSLVTHCHQKPIVDSVIFNEGSFVLDGIGYTVAETELEIIGNIFDNPELLE